MAFNSDAGAIISLAEACALTTAYQEADINPCHGVFFGRKVLEQILNQEGATGIRFYFGKNDEGKLSLVMAAVSDDGKDMLGLLGNRGNLCPPSDDSSPLCK